MDDQIQDLIGRIEYSTNPILTRESKDPFAKLEKSNKFEKIVPDFSALQNELTKSMDQEGYCKVSLREKSLNNIPGTLKKSLDNLITDILNWKFDSFLKDNRITLLGLLFILIGIFIWVKNTVGNFFD